MIRIIIFIVFNNYEEVSIWICFGEHYTDRSSYHHTSQLRMTKKKYIQLKKNTKLF